MKGKAKLAIAFVVLALVVGAFFVLVPPIQAQSTGETDDITDTSYSACGGIEGCRTSCGCGCSGNPNACGCGG